MKAYYYTRSAPHFSRDNPELCMRPATCVYFPSKRFGLAKVAGMTENYLSMKHNPAGGYHLAEGSCLEYALRNGPIQSTEVSHDDQPIGTVELSDIVEIDVPESDVEALFKADERIGTSMVILNSVFSNILNKIPAGISR